tara:strand:- start:742 stop:1161 length:420 start_codon:yes stop_codon:yes gene_type:complete
MIDPNNANPLESLTAYRTVKRNSLRIDVDLTKRLKQELTELDEFFGKIYVDRPYTYQASPIEFNRQQRLIIDALELADKSIKLLESAVKNRQTEFNNPSENLLKHNVEIAKDKWEYISEQELHADGYCSVQFQGGVCNG